MEVTAPDIATVKQLAGDLIKSDGNRLSATFIEFLFSQSRHSKPIVHQHNKLDLLDLVGLIDAEGEEYVMEIIEENKDMDLGNIIKKSQMFRKFRKQRFVENTVDLKERVQFSSIIKCPFCKSTNVETKTMQMRAADEPSTDKSVCRDCSKKFAN